MSALHGVGAAGPNEAWAVGDFIANHSFYQTLRDKLRWGTQPPYGGEQ